jgi:hypothetical protein
MSQGGNVSRKLSIVSIFVSLLLLAGCAGLGVNQSASNSTPAVQVLVVTATEEPKTIIVTATPEPVQYIIVTATPEAATAQPTATELPTATPLPTGTPVSTLAMANTVLQGSNTIYVSWNADGSFPSGFQVLWSTTNFSPTFPGDSSTYISDPNGRTTTIQTQPGYNYYIRVCRYVNGACDLYSNVVSVNSGTAPVYYPYPTYPPVYYYPPTYYHPNATATAVQPYTKIYSVRGSAGSGAAVIRWSASGSFPNGFLVLYADVPSEPTYGDYRYYSVSGSGSRYTTVSGTPGKTYYFRVCRFNGSSCDLYSNVYAYTFK